TEGGAAATVQGISSRQRERSRGMGCSFASAAGTEWNRLSLQRIRVRDSDRRLLPLRHSHVELLPQGVNHEGRVHPELTGGTNHAAGRTVEQDHAFPTTFLQLELLQLETELAGHCLRVSQPGFEERHLEADFVVLAFFAQVSVFVAGVACDQSPEIHYGL